MAIFGYDHGRPDYDLPHNRDRFALEEHNQPRVDSPNDIPSPPKDWYYANPVEVSIPHYLMPLPKSLLGNPMNVLYFHYFLDYTSRVLVTHDCGTNPFRTILPELAVRNENFLSLLLAYAACHRARLLCHAEPLNRISTWVTKLFPTFRQALARDAPISDTLFGTCVMLASLTLSFPLAFALPISWQDHLSVAQQMYRRRVNEGTSSGTKAAYFFTRWFAYLDTFGSMSGNVYHGSYKDWSGQLLAGEEDTQLKCLLGNTNQSLVFLSRVSQLAKTSEKERKETGRISEASALASQQLRFSLELATLEVQHKRYDCACASATPSTDVYRAVNAVLCYAALIVLRRRVYFLPLGAPLVQSSVNAIVDIINRCGSNIDIDIPDIILPLFLAGCESQDWKQRLEVLRRLERIGNAGMSQVARVRALLHDCWDNGKDWTELDHDVLLG